MPLRKIVPKPGQDRHPPSEKEKRAQRQKEYMEKHGKPEPRRKTLAVTDKYKKLKPFTRTGKQFGGRTNLLEELGRVEGEPSNRNRRAEISRVHGELNRGYKSGGAVLKGKKVGIQIK